jgi:hypothetical protein
MPVSSPGKDMHNIKLALGCEDSALLRQAMVRFIVHDPQIIVRYRMRA